MGLSDDLPEAKPSKSASPPASSAPASGFDANLEGLSDDKREKVIDVFRSDPRTRGFAFDVKSDTVHVDVRTSVVGWARRMGMALERALNDPREIRSMSPTIPD